MTSVRRRACLHCGALTSRGGLCQACLLDKQNHYGGRAWQRQRGEHLLAEPLCRACGARGEVVDHIVPVRAGGHDGHDNLQTLCAACHNRKTGAGA